MIRYVKESAGMKPILPPGQMATVTERGLEPTKARRGIVASAISLIARLFTRRK